MDQSAKTFFWDALQTPSPSGFEEPIQALIRKYVEPHAEEAVTDVHGNLIVSAGKGPRLMYAGHCDQIGLLVSHIDDLGYVYVQTIGGWDPQQLVGQAVTIWAADGPVPAVISRKPIHLLSTKERSQVVQLEQMWLDIGATDHSQASKKVSVGDPATLDLNPRELLGDLISGPGMDNKTGMWTVMEAFRRAVTSDKSLACHLHSVSTVQEEIGLRGAKTAAGSINPDVAIAVDVTHASDCPTMDKNKEGDIRLGAGPVIFRGPNINRKISAKLIKIAEENSIPYQLAAIARATPNDANVLQVHGGGVATGLVSIPNRYMHSAVEVVSTKDIDHAAELLALFAMQLSSSDDFIPSL